MSPAGPRRAFVGAVAVVLLALPACERPATPTSAAKAAIAARAPGGSLVYASAAPTGFNPSTAKDSSATVRNIVENLFFYAVKVRPDLSLDFSGLARSPRVVSRDPQVVEWRIHDNAVWSDGTPVTTADIKFFFDKTEEKDPAQATEDNPKGYINDVANHVGYDQITSLDVVDAKTFRATFAPLYADYEALWTDIPQAAWVQSQPGGWDSGLDTNPGPSAGPYTFAEYREGERVTLARNARWWGSVRPTLDSVVFAILAPSADPSEALRLGQVDAIYPEASLDMVERVRALPGMRSEVTFGPRFEHLTFNFANPALADIAVRRAIAHTIDRDGIVGAVMRPFSKKAARLDNRVLVAGQRGHKANGEAYWKADPARAEEVLRAAGYDKGDDGVYAKDGRRLSFGLSTTAGDAPREQQCELVRAQLAAVGVEIRLDHSPAPVLFGSRLPAGDFDIANYAFVGSAFPLSAAQSLYATGVDMNYGRYSNAAFDRLSREASGELDSARRLRMADAEDRLLWQDMVNLPLYHTPTFLAVRDTFVNIKDNATTEGPFWNSQEFGLAAKPR